MIGAIVGDIVGSRFEFDNLRSKEFEFLPPQCYFTDDTVMTIAVGTALADCKGDYGALGARTVARMQELGRLYPHCGFGGYFRSWIFSDCPAPYGSFGNGAAMRVSAVARVARTEEEARRLSRAVTEVTHDHPEGLRGAEATAMSAFLARMGASKKEIADAVRREYYAIDFTLDGIRGRYRFNETCQGSVPQALEAFFESDSFEDTIRGAVSIGGDSDTLAAIAGAVAEAYYGVPPEISARARTFLDGRLLGLLEAFEAAYPNEK